MIFQYVFGKKYIQYITSFNVSILTITLGFVAWSSPILPLLAKSDSPIGVTLSKEERAWVASIILLGIATGNVFMGTLMDLCGRKGLLLLSTVPLFLTWIMILFADSYIILLIARFIFGFGVVVPTGTSMVYISEITEADIRGKLCMFNNMMYEVGVLLVTVIGSYTTYDITAIVCSSIPVIFFILFVWMPESPYYYLRKGNIEMAKKSLQRLRSDADIEKELLLMQNNVENEMSQKSNFLEIFKTAQYRQIIFIAIGLKTLQQMSGHSAITNYMIPIFDETSTGLDSKLSSIICNFVAIPAVLVGSQLIDRMGRKPLYYLSTVGCALSLCCEFIYFMLQNRLDQDVTYLGWLPVVGLFGFNVFRCFGVYTIPIIIISELFPTNIKGYGISVTLVYSSLLAFSVSMAFPFMEDAIGIDICFLIYSISCLLGMFFVLFFVPETKGKTLADIQEDIK